MNKNKRIIILIMDGVGIGGLPDALDYECIGANTFHHAVSSITEFHAATLQGLGFGNISGVDGVSSVLNPKASYGRMIEITRGNDTFAGIWEMAGVIFNERFASFKPLMPKRLVAEMQKQILTMTLCNSYISGFLVLLTFPT